MHYAQHDKVDMLVKGTPDAILKRVIRNCTIFLDTGNNQ